jgi:hypothetical protein
VAGQVVLADVRFGFDDPRAQELPAIPSHQNLPEQIGRKLGRRDGCRTSGVAFLRGISLAVYSAPPSDPRFLRDLTPPCRPSIVFRSESNFGGSLWHRPSTTR